MKQRIELPRLSIDYSIKEGRGLLVLVGEVGEEFDPTMLGLKTSDSTVLNLKGIKAFNSIGIRQWVVFLKNLQKYSARVSFEECSIVMMDQFNLVKDTLGKGSVESFYGPYFCKEHGETFCLVDVKKYADKLRNGVAPKLPCPQCAKEMEFDALEEVYFSFLESCEEQRSAL